jgi:hypothetical protein
MPPPNVTAFCVILEHQLPKRLHKAARIAQVNTCTDIQEIESVLNLLVCADDISDLCTAYPEAMGLSHLRQLKRLEAYLLAREAYLDLTPWIVSNG